jgi:hypothetical protein
LSRGPSSPPTASIEIAREALSAWQAMDSSVTIDTLDVWSTELPEFDGPVMEARYAGIAGHPLRFIGISVMAEKTLFGPDIDLAAWEHARVQGIAAVRELRRSEKAA